MAWTERTLSLPLASSAPVASTSTSVVVGANWARTVVVLAHQSNSETRKESYAYPTNPALQSHSALWRSSRSPRRVARVHTPRPTETWTPIPHVTLIETVEDALRSTGLKIGNQVHSLSQEGDRYFGLTEVHGPQDANDYAIVLGLRNSHDKSFPVGLVAGASVFVCDNLSFSGEVRLTRKHTAHLQRDLPLLVASGVGRLLDLWHHQGERIDAYKNYRMRDKSAHDLVIRAVYVGALTNRMIPKVLKDWREPNHSEFQDRTAWSLFNAFTEVLKGNLPDLPKRTEVLHCLFDAQVRLPAAQLN